MAEFPLAANPLFFKDEEDFHNINEAIKDISNSIHKRLVKGFYLYRTVSIKIRLHDFKTFTRAKTLNYMSVNKDDMIRIAVNLAQEFHGNKIRLIGVRVSNLEEFKDQKKIEDFYQ